MASGCCDAHEESVKSDANESGVKRRSVSDESLAWTAMPRISDRNGICTNSSPGPRITRGEVEEAAENKETSKYARLVRKKKSYE